MTIKNMPLGLIQWMNDTNARLHQIMDDISRFFDWEVIWRDFPGFKRKTQKILSYQNVRVPHITMNRIFCAQWISVPENMQYLWNVKKGLVKCSRFIAMNCFWEILLIKKATCWIFEIGFCLVNFLNLPPLHKYESFSLWEGSERWNNSYAGSRVIDM